MVRRYSHAVAVENEPDQLRRPSEQIRALLLEAASEEFAHRGYARATMRTIAQRARVSLSVLYRHFENKEQLYLASLMSPFEAAIEAFAQAWRRQLTRGWADEEMVGEFVTDLHRHLSPRRQQLLQLLALRDDPNPQLAAGARRAIESAFSELTRMSEQEAHTRGWPRPAVSRHSVWLTIVAVVGQVVMQPWAPTDLLQESPLGQGGNDADVLTRLLLHGVWLERHPNAKRPT